MDRFDNTRLDDSILLKIHRQFSKDESVMALVAEIKRLREEIGMLTSEKQELFDRLSNKEKLLHKKVLPEWNKDEYVEQLKREIARHKQLRKTCRENMKHWMNLYFEQLRKNERTTD
jgi:hypothetical protein